MSDDFDDNDFGGDDHDEGIDADDDAKGDDGADEQNSEEEDDDALEKDDEVGEEEVVQEDPDEVVEGNECVHRHIEIKKGLKKGLRGATDSIVVDDEDDVNQKTIIGKWNVISDPDLRITDPEMTPSEVVRILGIATRQISKGRNPNVEMDGNSMSVMEKAKLELKNRRTPVYILRPYPDRKTAERWNISEMTVPEWIW